MTNVLQGLTVKLNKLPPSVIDDVIKRFTTIAEQEGGKVSGHQLSAEAKDRSVSDGSASVTMAGFPSGFWVWREQGVRAHRIRPKRRKALAGGLGHPVWGAVLHPGVGGRGAWTKTVNRAGKELQEAAERALAAIA